jgi:hypothetical protein
MNPPKSYQELISFTGNFKYTDNIGKNGNKDGSISIIGDWEKQNIVLVSLPINKINSNKPLRLQCHKKIKDNVLEIFKEYGYNSYMNSYPIRLLGSFMPRHKLWNVKNGLSIHSYGLAIDINWDTNPVGKHGDMPDYVVKLFEKYGWSWGGHWKNPLDEMHMQFYNQ